VRQGAEKCLFELGERAVIPSSDGASISLFTRLPGFQGRRRSLRGTRYREHDPVLVKAERHVVFVQFGWRRLEHNVRVNDSSVRVEH
jgi:hypothetical protein